MSGEIKENLDNYITAYGQSFPFHDDNIGVLRAYAKKFIEACRDRRSIRLCSLGIGYEIVSMTIGNELSEAIDKYVIVEGSPAIIDKFKTSMSFPFDVEMVEAYFEEYVPSEGFDVIEMGFVLEHVDDPALIVRRFATFLKPGGVIIAAVPNARSLHRELGHRAGLLQDMYALSKWDLELGHKRYFDSATFRELFEREDLNVEKELGLMLKPLSTAQLQSLNLPKEVWETLYFSGDIAPQYAYSLYIEATTRK
ncbi:class I SAM-dependent methyltransferase [Rhizobium binxianense]|uniref:class I SAM-dependent methyltransferase n=1 Tax=Rhizobium binxianense TaxID=3024242 RepID=UPI002362A123|nr:class I SAM-dependent methyltransferase [Rhizobium sp. MJ37]MDC9832649.1 class I SAM-dependent methyltransferase [Rhizobium sp. MJ37]